MNTYWILLAVSIMNFEVGTPVAVPGASFTNQKECASEKAKLTKAFLQAQAKAAPKDADVQANSWCVKISFKDGTIEGAEENDK